MGASSGTKRRLPRRDARRAAEEAIAAANELTNDDFVSSYIKPSASSWPSWTHPATHEAHALSLRAPADMAEADLEACFALVERTSGDDYRRAAGGWHPKEKRAEMRSPGLRYILVRRAETEGPNPDKAAAAAAEKDDGEIRAFASFMPTWEDDHPVVYCYEIHLVPELERTGLGRLLMGHVTAAADRIGALDKTMLTCFVANAHARRFYERLGFDVDESSPRPRRLRDRVVEPEYVILCRSTSR
ncbi:hypothetical protein V2A60_007636 [Cordyceps javanica]|uniref:N-alpha-acetyltransferase 40 n=1 Tax=Cordyceps javanica TaxID=43265 RepID=A0A545VA89_9HYPO|nr:GNAT family acetyltransferase Nat4 [Cordyceps javanica]TQW09864.1 GNAT family acetyltransferase Nat4 [Cordyceps javanica]